MRPTTILKKIIGPTQSSGRDDVPSVMIRYARPDDALALLDLAYLDSSRAPDGVVIVAEVGGQLWAARSLDDGHAIADPFKPSGELSFLLAERARQVSASMPRRRETRVQRQHSLAA
jgi:hypothetical protein